jgi:hypothetical protein
MMNKKNLRINKFSRAGRFSVIEKELIELVIDK